MDKLYGKLKHEAVKLKREAKRVTELETALERNLREATSNKNWGCPNSVLYELASDASSYHDRQKILQTVTEKLQSSPDKWRRILKTLTLLEFLIKNGPEQMIVELQSMMSMVRRLTNFEVSEEGRERGGSVREKAKLLVEIMGDNARLRSERDQAKEHRAKFGGGGNLDKESGGYGQGGIGSETRSSGGGGGGGATGETRGSLEDRFQELKKRQQNEQAEREREREERMSRNRGERDSRDSRDSGDSRRDDDDRGRDRDNDRDRGERRRGDSPRRRAQDSDDSPRDRGYGAFDPSRGPDDHSDDDGDLLDSDSKAPAAKPPAPAPQGNLLDLMDAPPAAAAPVGGLAPPPGAAQASFADDFGDFSAAPAAAAPADDFGFGDFQATPAPAPAPVPSMSFDPSGASAAPFFAGAPALQAPVFGGAPVGGQQPQAPVGGAMGGGYGGFPMPPVAPMTSPAPMGGAPAFGGGAQMPMAPQLGGGAMAMPMAAPASQPAAAPATAAVPNDTFLSGISSSLLNLDIGSGSGPPTAPPSEAPAAAAPTPEKKSDPAALDALNAFSAFSG